MAAHRVGYGRKSTRDQDLEAEEKMLAEAGCNKIFVEAISGTKASRPQWDACREYLRPGDQLVATRLDRLGRSTKDLLETAEWCKAHDVTLVIVKQDIDTSKPEGKLLFTVLAAIAEFERELIVSRTLDGLAAARARGKKGGRKPALSTKQVENVRKRYEAREGTVAELAADYGVSRQSIYRALERA